MVPTLVIWCAFLGERCLQMLLLTMSVMSVIVKGVSARNSGTGGCAILTRSSVSPFVINNTTRESRYLLGQV